MISENEVLETQQCRLRYPSEADFEHIWSASRFPGFNDGMRWDPPASMDELKAPLDSNRAGWAEGTVYTWTVECTTSSEFLGRAVIRREPEADVWSIGFWVHPSKQRRGVAREAATAMIRLGFERLGARRIVASHATWNLASRKVLEAVGMRFVRVNPQGFQKHGSWVEAFEYEILPGDT